MVFDLIRLHNPCGNKTVNAIVIHCNFYKSVFDNDKINCVLLKLNSSNQF